MGEKRSLGYLAIILGCDRQGGFYRDREEEPRSHFYMCWTEHRENYRNLLKHTLDHPLYVGLEVLSLLVPLLIHALLVKTALIKSYYTAIQAIVNSFCLVSKKYYGVKEPQYISVSN